MFNTKEKEGTFRILYPVCFLSIFYLFINYRFNSGLKSKIHLFFILNLISFTILGQTKKEIDSLNEKGWGFAFEKIDSAELILNKAIVKAHKISYSKGLSDAKSRLAVVYDLKGKTDQSLKLFFESISIQEENKDSIGLSFSYNNLGLLYYAQYNYNKAIENIQKSLEIDLKLGDRESVAGAMINIGIMYTYIDSLEQSFSLYQDALAIYSDLNDSLGIATCYANIGKLYIIEEDFQKALYHFKLNEAFLKNYNHSERMSSCYYSLAGTYLKLEDYSSALKYALLDLEYCTQFKLVNRKQFAFDVLNEIYVAMGDYKKAHQYLKSYTILRDSLLNEDRNTSLNELQIKYEIEKKENEILLMKAEKMEKENEILVSKSINKKQSERNATQRNLIWMITFIAIVIIAIVLWAFISKKKINRLLSEKNQLNEEIISQKEILISEVHHRVKNNLQLINSILELQMKSVENQEAVSNILDIQKRVASIAILHQFLYRTDEVDRVEINLYITELCEGIKKSFQINEQEILMHFSLPQLSTSINTAVPLGLIINELVTNSFKHAFKGRKNGEIHITLQHKDEALILEYKDDGIGVVEKTDKISFGLKMIKSLCRQLQAEWEVKNNKGFINLFKIKRYKIYEKE